MKKNSIEEVHVLRALAFLAVVLQHSIGHYLSEPDTTLSDGVMFTLFLLISKFAVPVFIFITGLVLFYNYDGPLRYGSFLQKRLKDIGIPYLFWSLVYAAPALLQSTGVFTGIQQFAGLAFTGKASYHLWYIVMIIPFYVTFPLWRWVIRNVRSQISTVGRAIAVMMLLAIVYVYGMTLIWPIYQVAEQWNVPVLTPMLTEYADRNSLYFFYYFVLGAVSGLALTQWREWLRRNGPLVYAVFFSLAAYLTYRVVAGFENTPASQNHYEDLLLLRPVTAVFLIASILVTYKFGMRAAESVKGVTRRALWMVSQYSYGAYLIHALMLTWATLLSDLLLPQMNVTLRMILAFILCSAMSVLATFALSRIPFLGQWMTGLGKAKKKPQPAPGLSADSMKG
ncbi:acyltransferase [Paenibacillus elgii]|uniref:acyltransferase n=1 Tax=Paenibacillus elgii TaxID=189691 RepID=UPI000FD8BB59|nr:acyltransferase [Paenibacillus elgii]NEN84922.1 acyltransferase [Paenibacillus elgii]